MRFRANCVCHEPTSQCTIAPNRKPVAMALEAFAASLSSPTGTCARRPSFDRNRSQKALQPLPLNVRSAGRSAPSPKPSRDGHRLSRQACRATPKDKSSAGDLGEFDLAEFVEAKVDSGECLSRSSLFRCRISCQHCVLAIGHQSQTVHLDLVLVVTSGKGFNAAARCLYAACSV